MVIGKTEPEVVIIMSVELKAACDDVIESVDVKLISVVETGILVSMLGSVLDIIDPSVEVIGGNDPEVEVNGIVTGLVDNISVLEVKFIGKIEDKVVGLPVEGFSLGGNVGGTAKKYNILVYL